jgi:hypothetical protein
MDNAKGRNESYNPRKIVAQGLYNSRRNYARELNTLWKKLVLELDNSK